jgi:hypothetical protein
MKKAFGLVAFAALVLLFAYGDASASHQGATSPCCQGYDLDNNPTTPNKACNEDAVGVPDGSGCQENGGSCIGGAAGPGGIRGCICVGPACVSGPVPPGGPTDVGTTPAACTKNAVTACCAANACH